MTWCRPRDRRRGQRAPVFEATSMHLLTTCSHTSSQGIKLLLLILGHDAGLIVQAEEQQGVQRFKSTQKHNHIDASATTFIQKVPVREGGAPAGLLGVTAAAARGGGAGGGGRGWCSECDCTELPGTCSGGRGAAGGSRACSRMGKGGGIGAAGGLIDTFISGNAGIGGGGTGVVDLGTFASFGGPRCNDSDTVSLRRVKSGASGISSSSSGVA